MLAFRLTRELGGMTVRQLLRSMDSAELSEWAAYFMVLDEYQKQAQLEAEAQSKLSARRPRG
jgi:hypothetical protein